MIDLLIHSQVSGALAFSRRAHEGQTVKGTELPYFFHVSAVFTEVLANWHTEYGNLNLALCLAALHDVVEDTSVTISEIRDTFGDQIACDIEALTKNRKLPKQAQIADSLVRLKAASSEARLVKIADRLVNLAPPPREWDNRRVSDYHKDAKAIWTSIGSEFGGLEIRFTTALENYARFADDFET